MEITDEILIDLYKRMVRVRLFEEEAGRLAESARLPGFLHLYVGEEAVASGVCAALENQDQITSTHRGHGHLLAKGGDFNRMMAELMGKSTGYCNGKGGSMHICDLDLAMLGANGIVGAGVPISVGAAYANKLKKNGLISVAFFGDGATNIGAFHEAANMAAALSLPMLFVCENNEYAEYSPRNKTMAITDVIERAAAYGFPGAIVDGMDCVAVFEATSLAIEKIRKGEGPMMLECKTYRFYDHVGVKGTASNYRTDEEVEEMRKRDPLLVHETRLIDSEVMDAESIQAIKDEVQKEVDMSVEFAENSPSPELEDMLVDVYTTGESS
ncbi:MAG: thiamine pyrophosphate-dependent dehydrogenase E1 component subunit alpha [Acidimicrobiales bacterium]|mgnify:CR=1 FL=1|jgi:pyruvate dehydrogenase E1 component alpha subunit|nr:pyruvate dehydrogenase (acetyl-transferring) E1 component subunit alpha [Acidimicrobiaceae bacterium]MDP6161185.1 thiamine pyrophosphate-dependent dehydrogenase E1 component subunit alpha [Acidimicrobiales bacterium]MDP6285254.1 thiamine pyrophosphate-dependent dehydrogenase E1 component subunit alpha [Acidimicrobiales bacterium]HJL91306.1 thiamine pyrophosphate-dependent dehydrogenase E1 component subunit alpha [Acidimicrobiales bacterium]HJO40919.1 thiamine pyrophosphate-dependent dehydrog|tara:strand:- start:22883 stop:23863 length:981 start_codon:yes stop_codon:yes gene_type:complete